VKGPSFPSLRRASTRRRWSKRPFYGRAGNNTAMDGGPADRSNVIGAVAPAYLHSASNWKTAAVTSLLALTVV
jgi:hypothetical protein